MVGGVDAMVVLVSALDSSQAYWAAIAAIVGSVAGSLVLFYIARKGGEAYLLRYTAGWPGNSRMMPKRQRSGSLVDINFLNVESSAYCLLGLWPTACAMVTLPLGNLPSNSKL